MRSTSVSWNAWAAGVNTGWVLPAGTVSETSTGAGAGCADADAAAPILAAERLPIKREESAMRRIVVAMMLPWAFLIVSNNADKKGDYGLSLQKQCQADRKKVPSSWEVT